MTNPSDNIRDGYWWITQALNSIREYKWVALKVRICERLHPRPVLWMLDQTHVNG